MEPFKDFIEKVRNKLAFMEFEDLFPQNRKCDTRDMRSVVFFTGIYVVALIVASLIIVLGTAIPAFLAFFAWLLYIIGGAVALYALVGMIHILLQFMKFGG